MVGLHVYHSQNDADLTIFTEFNFPVNPTRAQLEQRLLSITFKKPKKTRNQKERIVVTVKAIAHCTMIQYSCLRMETMSSFKANPLEIYSSG